MPGRRLVGRLAALTVAAACLFVAVVALGATFYQLLLLALPAVAAAAVTAGVFALVALVIALVLLNRGGEPESEDGLSDRMVTLFRQRPMLATAAALAGGWVFLRNPALVSLVAAAFTEKSRGRRR